MNAEEKLDCIESYLQKYFNEMLVEDIEKMMKKSKEDECFKFTIPYILLVSAGINFLEAQKFFREEYIRRNSESVYNKLTEILREEKIQELSPLIENLKSKGHFFEAEVSPSSESEMDCFN
ncbi:hypothetical protein KJ664_01520 [Patescibacteria group bacterium]|nr:hypothetical protein [Patescibacteria group bacterium]